MKLIHSIFPLEAVWEGISISLHAFEKTLHVKGYKGLLVVFLGLILSWHVYVPVHELLHAAGCFLAGGDVSALNLKPQYGGLILSKIFPFVVPESEYAGRLTGFATPSAWAYALVDLFPFSISLLGISLIRYCHRKGSAFFLGLGFILAFAPFMSISGDYYEAISLVSTQLAEAINPSLPAGALISDDVFCSISVLWNEGSLNRTVGCLIFLGILMAVYLAFLTLALQVWISYLFFGASNKKGSREGIGKR